ncbi:hypothetical protein CDN99_22005 [Roseateles aquatilis]|uniref:MFS transporter n=1 Tax=Roseateles aquatilis TaxID=431061 RepID=A0A246IZH9_9BURK|nr:MFS transporter [Roseateles aquatilis]OWQ85749.1 hypothetical protein CDN99_22005 [Roseateles aquatilis]
MKFPVSFIFFVGGLALSSLSLHCLRFGVAWLAMRETGSAVVFAAIFGASSLVEIYSKPLLAPLADYFERLAIVRACGALATALAILLVLQVLLLPFSLWLLALLLMVLSMVAALRDPASAGLVPNLVSANQLTSALALRSTVASVSSLVGPMIGALLLAAGGIPTAMAAAVVASAAAVLLWFQMSTPKGESASCPSRSAWPQYLSSWHLRMYDGLRAVFLTRAERMMALVVALTNAGLFPFFAVTLPLWVNRDLNSSPLMMGAMEAGFSIGILMGSLGGTRLLNARFGRYATLIFGNGALGAGLVAASVTRVPTFILVSMLVGGLGFSLFNINASWLRAAATPDNFRSRMNAGVAFMSCFLNPFAAQCFGYSIEAVGAAASVAASGTLILVSTALLLLNKDLRVLLGLNEQAVVGIYAKLYPTAFANRR